MRENELEESFPIGKGCAQQGWEAAEGVRGEAMGPWRQRCLQCFPLLSCATGKKMNLRSPGKAARTQC